MMSKELELSAALPYVRRKLLGEGQQEFEESIIGCEVVRTLEALGVGSIQLPCEGWVHISSEDGGWGLMWTSHKEAHRPISAGQSAWSALFGCQGELVQHCESALSMWIKYDSRLFRYSSEKGRQEGWARVVSFWWKFGPYLLSLASKEES